MQNINAAASPEVQINENFETLSWGAVYGKRPPATTGLTWGYYGGRWSGFSVADGTLTLTNSATNYIVVELTTGTISVSTSATNWNNAASYARVYKLTTAGGIVTVEEDHRGGNQGVFGVSGGAQGGKHAIPIMASTLVPNVNNGCSTLQKTAGAANQPDMVYVTFDNALQQYATFSMIMPKSWNEGTLTFKPVWAHGATTVNFGVVFTLRAVALRNDDPFATTYGTAQSSADTGGTTDDVYQGPESSAITVGGTVGAECLVVFELSRDVAAGGDTLAVPAKLLGLTLFITTDADDDA